MKRLAIIFLAAAILCGLSSLSNLRAEGAPGIVITPDLQFSYADQLFREKDYEAARVEFKRFVHFFPGETRVDEAWFKIAMALYHGGQFRRAAEAFNAIILDQDNDGDPFVREACFMQSKSFLAMNNRGYAQIVLQNFLKLTQDADTKDKIYLELAKIHIMETRKLGRDGLDQAEHYLTLISPKNRESHQVPVQLKAIDKARKAPKKNPALSGILAVIPGGGFLYCERYKDAFVSFCLNAGLMIAAYQAFDHDNPALGGVITFVETGFYTGNIYGSVTAAHKYNKREQIRVLDQAFQLEAGVNPVNQSFLFTLNHPF